jgi:hypothetical protein
MTLIFIYNADADLFSKITDFAHKIISPKTYNCALCSLTYGNLGMKEEWAQFIKTLPAEIIFLHKDEFLKQYPQREFVFPLIFKKDKDTLTIFLSADDINTCIDLKALELKIATAIDTAK